MSIQWQPILDTVRNALDGHAQPGDGKTRTEGDLALARRWLAHSSAAFGRGMAKPQASRGRTT